MSFTIGQEDCRIARRHVLADDAADEIVTQSATEPAPFLTTRRRTPLQVAARRYPTNAGPPTINRFLGNDAVEPADADARYGEVLTRLPSPFRSGRCGWFHARMVTLRRSSSP